MLLLGAPPHGVQKFGNGPFSVREFGKLISFGIREKTRYGSGIRENISFREVPSRGSGIFWFGNSGKWKILFGNLGIDLLGGALLVINLN